VPTEIPFGHLDMEGTCRGVDVGLYTDKAFASTASEGEITGFDVTYVDHRLQVNLWFGIYGEPPTLPIQEPYTFADNVTLHWLDDEGDGVDEVPAESAAFTLTDYTEEGMIGDFSADFGDGDVVSGHFAVTFAVGYGIEPPEEP